MTVKSRIKYIIQYINICMASRLLNHFKNVKNDKRKNTVVIKLFCIVPTTKIYNEIIFVSTILFSKLKKKSKYSHERLSPSK